VNRKNRYVPEWLVRCYMRNRKYQGSTLIPLTREDMILMNEEIFREVEAIEQENRGVRGWIRRRLGRT